MAVSARYWRVYANALNTMPTPTYGWNIHEIELFVAEDATGTNLCSGATASASDTNSSYAASRAIDGNSTTSTSRWECRNTVTEYQWWKVDLGSAYQVKSLKFKSYYAGFEPAQVLIQSSPDNSTWTTVATIDLSATTDWQTFTDLQTVPAVAASLAMPYSLRHVVTASRVLPSALGYDLVAASKSMPYSLRAAVSATVAASYSLRHVVESSRTMRFYLSNEPVWSTVATPYTLIHQVSATKALPFSSALVRTSVELPFSLQHLVAGTIATKYSLTTAVSADCAVPVSLLEHDPVIASRTMPYAAYDGTPASAPAISVTVGGR